MTELYVALTGLLMSFFFAGSEAAFTTSNKLRLEIWTRQRKPFSAASAYFMKRPEHFFSTILIGNNVANILFSTFGMVYLMAFFEETTAWALLTLVVLFWGEIFPKNLFRAAADKIVLECLFLSRLFYFILKPFIISISFLIDKILGLLRIKHESVTEFFSRDELELLLREAEISGVVHKFEQKFITNVLDFTETHVREAMTPRTEISAASDDSSWQDLIDLLVGSAHSHVLIYHESLDNIKGVIFIYDLLARSDDIRALIRPIGYVPENKSCAELLREFQAQNISVAVVLDEYGGTAGSVTTDDLIQVVFGEFEHIGQKDLGIRALNRNTWLVDARKSMADISEAVNITFPDGDYETFAGFLLDRLGRFPMEKENLIFDGFRVEIIKATTRKIVQVKLIRNV